MSLTCQALRDQAQALLDAGVPAIAIEIAQVQGSTPRNTGARMLVSRDHTWGTIGGGHLEWQAQAMAQAALRECEGNAPNATVHTLAPWTQRYALGPTLGQCCGGVVVLHFEPLGLASLSRWPQPRPRFTLDLHGAGHVGQAIIHLLKDIDCQVRWIDQRLDEHARPGDQATLGLPTGAEQAALPGHIQCLPTDDAASEVAGAPQASCHLVLTHRHDLDLAIVDALLRRDDVRSGQAWVGMIGSQTKRAAFEHRLQARGHAPEVIARLNSPIGLPEIGGKEPAVIAIAVVGQLLALG